MNKLLFSLSTLLLLAVSCSGQEKFPMSKISTDLETSTHPKIVVFIPSISDSTEYASMVVQAFKNYFVEKLAFDPKNRPSADIDIVLVTNTNNSDSQLSQKEENPTQSLLISGFLNQQLLVNLFDTTGMYVYQADSKLFSELNIPLLNDNNRSSVLFLLDKENNIVWRDNDYRGQGEHLKPLEYKIKKLLGLPYSKPENKNQEIKVGDKAPEVTLPNSPNYGNYTPNGIRVLTFYPAAYSGVFDTDKMMKRISTERLSMMSCAVQITSFDRIRLINPDVMYYAISESTPEILNNWKQALGTYHIEYVNDADYSIALAFGAYNPEGYSNRMTIIIDRDGTIAYLDKDYTLDKEVEIQIVIQKLQAKKKK